MPLRSLDKLKKQIKEAKEAKKLARKAAKEGVKADSGEVKLLFDGTEVKQKKESKSILEKEENEDLFVVKKTGSLPTEGSHEVVADEEKRGKVKKGVKALKISKDGVVKASAGEERLGKRVIFDDDGGGIPATAGDLGKLFEQSVEESNGEDIETIRREKMDEHSKRVKERIDRGRKEVPSHSLSFAFRRPRSMSPLHSLTRTMRGKSSALGRRGLRRRRR
jgi:hypothetical protein